jgi:hypothetical protein
MFFGFIGYPTPQFAAPGPQYGGRLGWMFLSDGTVDQVDLDTGQVTSIGQIWTPIPPQYWASAKVWRPRYFGNVEGQPGGVLFGSPQGYYAWDGQNLYSPGDDAPDWLTNMTSSDPNFVQLQMPEGLPGIYTMEVFEERMFVAGKDVISFSAPSNGADFSTTDGGGSIGYFGDKLVYSYMDLASSSGYLFVFGDSSTDIINNVQLFGSGTSIDPYVTNFNYSNVDPQVGQRFPRPVGRWGRYMIMYNGAGIFLMQGGEALEIGQKVTGTWNSLDTSNFLPTFAPATMFGMRVVLCNGSFVDAYGIRRSLMLMWHPAPGTGQIQQPFWSVASQNLELTQIGSYEQDSIIRPYGTDGNSLYELFARPDPTLPKRLITKALRGQERSMLTIKNFKRAYLEMDDHDGGGVVINGTAGCFLGNVMSGSEDVNFAMRAGEGFKLDAVPLHGHGIAVIFSLQSISPDFTIERLHVGSEERTLFGA